MPVNESSRTKISKFLSLVLRHKPEEIGLTLDENGWARVSDLLEATARAGRSFTHTELLEVVENNDKKRFAFDPTGEYIRASQGHSIAVDLEFTAQAPPALLYHGTAERNVASILESGLSKMQRHHVHLSADIETAETVGRRYGKPVVFRVDTAAMTREGFEFFLSANRVWLVDRVPAKFIKTL
jgi:putative RNA 2'-phosphotransferase